jgi:fucose permease
MSNTILRLLPIMVTFFAMGAVDFVGIATNYVKLDFQLSDTIANLFTSMVFFWFLIFSVPTGILMNKIGRRKTVILSLWITVVALAIPFLGYNLFIILLSFSLLL